MTHNISNDLNELAQLVSIEVITKYNKGWSVHRIAHHYNVHVKHVQYIINKHHQGVVS